MALVCVNEGLNYLRVALAWQDANQVARLGNANVVDNTCLLKEDCFLTRACESQCEIQDTVYSVLFRSRRVV